MTHRFLPTPLRRALEKAVKAARDVAEEGAADAVRRLGVADPTAPAHLSDEMKALRRRLRAHARTLGDQVSDAASHEVRHLIEATGYAQWHRRLFARFLAERGLLRHPEHGPVTLEDCEELAKLEGFTDAWTAAESYGARMLPGVFNPNDPALMLEFAPEHAQALRALVEGLDASIFQADDSLGWTYQFWRAAEKDRINKGGDKIGASELPAVTQLFTEPYMVRFLLHNTLGAWRAGKILASRPELAADASDENELRAAVALPGYDFDMLRFVKVGEDAPRWQPAAGSYPSWPTNASKLTLLDPCCGSGHFLTEALTILTGLRMDEEGLAAAEAVAAVLTHNLFGLEIDGRCVQIAAFAVALAGWKIGDWQALPSLHIAWVGAPPPLPKPEFVALANGDAELREGLDKLWDIFAHAELLGSLTRPTGGNLMSPQRLGRIEPLLSRLVEKTKSAEPASAEGAVAAQGMAGAANILASRYTMVATNPPFLGQGNYGRSLLELMRRQFPTAKADLCVSFISRAHELLNLGGTAATVSKQEWCFLPTFYNFRKSLLNSLTIDLLCFLGEEAWEAFGQRGPKATLSIITSLPPSIVSHHVLIDISEEPDRNQKIARLEKEPLQRHLQSDQIKNPASRISSSGFSGGEPLALHAELFNGIVTGDSSRFQRLFWENNIRNKNVWIFQQSAAEPDHQHSGMSGVVRWDDDFHHFVEERLDGNVGAWIRGTGAWNRLGVVVSGMRYLSTTSYEGTAFDNNCSVIVPRSEDAANAVTTFCRSPEFTVAVRKLNPKTSVTDDTFVQVPFDINHWRRVAAQRYPDGPPKPFSDDPTQWLFHGHPAQAATGAGLHIALARLAGYRWPAEGDADMRLSAEARAWIAKSASLPDADNDGLLSLEAVAGEQSLAQRLHGFLAAAFGDGWSDSLGRRLVVETDMVLDKKAARDPSLETWLRDRAFRQHCKLFQDRPFLWQVWDGTPDGFSAFIHYHRLNTANLSKLTYTLLGDWISRMTGAGEERRVEKAKILQQKLTAILEGEAPLDIFVRWKPLHKQPIGWDPDLDDGVRLNIRPFVTAGVLRETPKIKWGVDRGKDVASAPWFPIDKGERNNDRHLTLAEKRATRGLKG